MACLAILLSRWPLITPNLPQGILTGTLASMSRQPTGTITFLFTDIAGSTRLWEERPSVMEGAVARHDELLRSAIELREGYVFTTAGDGFCVAFADPLDAVSAALAAQQSLGSESWEVGDLRVRMGLHTGVAQEREGDYFGPTVNRAARIADAGNGGQVLISRATRDLVAARLPAEVHLRSLGEHRLKDLGTPELLHQLVHSDLRSEFPALRTLDAHRNNLPVELTSFVGRHDEIAETTDYLGRSRLVTLTGVGGSGKTRLALQTAAEMLGAFPDGVWMVELASLADGAEVPRHVAETLGLEWRSPQEPGGQDHRTAMDAVLEFLGDRTGLLVLDNCEHLIGSVAEFTQRLLQGCRNLRVLTTSREGLGVRGEHLIQVPSLGLPPMFGVNDNVREYPDALELFAERAAAVSGFDLNDETAPTVAAICVRLDGMPLAIELAAARTRMLNVEQIAERLNDTFRLLTGGARNALPRQQTLLATVDWSYQLLDGTERKVFDRLAVFRGGFFLEAAEAIVSDEGVGDYEVFDIVASLVDKSMVQARAESGRFGLLETLRQFALQKLTDAGEGDRWRERHADYYATLAEEAHSGTRSRDQVAWFERLDRDHENVKAALGWTTEQGRIETTARIANGLWWFWGARGHVDTALNQIRGLLVRDDLPAALLTGLLTGAAYLEFEGGDIAASLPVGQEAVDLARTLDDPTALSLALIYWANTASHNFGMWDEAHAGYDEGYGLGEQLGSDWLMGWHALNKGWIYRIQGNFEESERLLLIARDHFRRAEVPMGLGWALSGLGALRRGAGDHQGALEFGEEARDTHAAYGNLGATSWALFTMAISLSYLGRHDEALEAVDEAMVLLQDITKNFDWGPLVAGVQRRRGDLPAAIDALEEYAAENDVTWSDFMVQSGLVASDAGRHDLAAPLLAFGIADMTRDGSRLPLGTEEESNAAWAKIRGQVDDPDAITTEWSAKTIDEVLPVTLETLAKIRRTLTAAND